MLPDFSFAILSRLDFPISYFFKLQTFSSPGTFKLFIFLNLELIEISQRKEDCILISSVTFLDGVLKKMEFARK